MRDIERKSLLIGVGATIVIVLLVWGIISVVRTYIDSRLAQQKADKRLHLEIAVKSHNLTWAYGTTPDSSRISKQKAFTDWMDSIARDSL